MAQAPDMTLTFIVALLITLSLMGLVAGAVVLLKRRAARRRLMEVLDQRIEVVTRGAKS